MNSQRRGCSPCKALALHVLLPASAMAAVADQAACSAAHGEHCAVASAAGENIMLQTSRHWRSEELSAERRAWCCEKCSGSAFCSPNSGNCYDTQRKSYYASCPATTNGPDSSSPSPPSSASSSTCCGKCDSQYYCSPNSGNCYWSKNKEYYETCKEPETLENPMTVLSYNVMYSNFPSRLGGVSNNINRNLKPDVMGLQECMNMDQMQNALGRELLAARDTDTFNCIFYKPGSGISYGGQSNHVYLGDGNRDSYSKRYFSYTSLVRNGVKFWVMSTHWCIRGPCSGSEAGRRHEDSARRMLRFREEQGAGDAPTIIVGDLNSHMNNLDNDLGVQYFLKNGFDMAGKSDLWGGIDYVFVSKGHWKIGKTYIGDFGGSDHKPIQVDVDFADSVTATTVEPSSTTAALPGPTGTTAPASCCDGCSSKAYCSPYSFNCYDTKRKDYYATCKEQGEGGATTTTATSEGSSGKAPCCASCGTEPYCSPVSNNCYAFKKRDYYELCSDEPPSAPAGGEAWCCANCNGASPYCSPNSGNCYDTKRKSYYETCSVSLAESSTVK